MHAGDDMTSPYAVKNLTSDAFRADSATGLLSPWATVGRLPRLCSFEGPMAFLRRRFYCMSSAPFGVMVYDVGANEWAKLQAPMRRFLRSPSVAMAGGRVVMVAAVEKWRLSVPRSVRVWELAEEEGRAWGEVERMPMEFLGEFEGVERGRGFECVGSGEYVAVMVKGSAEVVVFNMRRRGWQWAPHCPFVDVVGGGGCNGGLRGLGYELRLATTA